MSELSVLANLLRLASDEFGNHGCNDYEIPNTPENYSLVNDALKWDNAHIKPTVSKDKTTIYASDYVLMAYFAFLIDKGNLTIYKTAGE